MKFSLLPIGSTIFLLSGVANADQSEHHPRHHLAVFVGGGVENAHGHSESGYALGLKYELRFHLKWGIGVDLEKLFGDDTNRSEVIALPLSYHPSEKWRLFTGPGMEFGSNENKYLMRVGVAYEIPFHRRWTASPEVLVDFIEGGATTYILGISVGYGF